MKLPKQMTIGELEKAHRKLGKTFPEKKAVIIFSNGSPKLRWE